MSAQARDAEEIDTATLAQNVMDGAVDQPLVLIESPAPKRGRGRSGAAEGSEVKAKRARAKAAPKESPSEGFNNLFQKSSGPGSRG
jgi:hypothetical protein